MNITSRKAILFGSIVGVIAVGIIASAFAAVPMFSWTSGGVAVCESTGLTDLEFPFPQVASDGSGGAIVIWQDKRSGEYDIYAQHISTNSAVQWSENGIAVCDATGDQRIDPSSEDNYPYSNLIVPDGDGGAIIVWRDERSGSWDLYAQRLDADGSAQWTANGVAICTVAADQEKPQIVSDGAGGVIITWQDARNGNNDIFAQRIDVDGNITWTENGVEVCSQTSSQTDPQVLYDATSGIVITWHDERTANFSTYAQKLDMDGNVQWTANGVLVSEPPAGNEWFPVLMADEAGGSIVAWNDTRRSAESGYALDFSVYVQRLDTSGSRLWDVGGDDYNGIAITYKDGRQEDAVLVTDTEGGAIIAWDDDPTENEDPPSSNFNIYAQRINSVGAAQWTAGGLVVCDATEEQTFPRMVVDGAGGAVVVWHDKRSGDYDVYTQRMNAQGEMLWTANGVMVNETLGEQAFPRAVSGTSDTILVTWQDSRNDRWDIYVQKIDLSGGGGTALGGCSLLAP